ncbi:MAG: hypothetical protein KF761_03630 [Salinibacterium sp.]|nr:hypothetical protein [Salinibacterium sp.]
MSTVAPFLVIPFTVLLFALAVLQILLIVGMPLGRFAWGGTQDRLSPSRRIAAGVAIVLYAAFVVIALLRSHVIATPLSDLVGIIAMWVVTSYLFFSVVPNLASKSPQEKRLMVPVSAALAILALLIALS